MKARMATNLYAAFNVATGEVLGRVTRRHRATEFRQFLAQIDRATPPDLPLHLIVDNSSTPTTEAIRVSVRHTSTETGCDAMCRERYQVMRSGSGWIRWRDRGCSDAFRRSSHLR